MRVLGLSAFHRDSAAVLVIDGRPIAGARESWFTRRRRDPAFPRRAARDCLRRAGLRATELDLVVVSRKPLLEFERVLVSGLRAFPRSAPGFAREMFLWLGDRLWMRNRVASELGVSFERVRFVEHHRAHAAAAYLRSPFDEAALLTIDDGGEWATSLLGRADPRGIEVQSELHFPHSLALFAAAVARHIGLDPADEDATVEALAAGGRPSLQAELAARVPQAADGSYRVESGSWTVDRSGELQCAPELARALEAGVGGVNAADVAASLQRVLEERALGVARELHRRTGASALCFAGSLAANRRLVARLAEEGPFASISVPICPDESEAALGAALLASSNGALPPRVAPDPFLGAEPLAALDAGESSSRALGAEVARGELELRLARGESIAWVRGRRELGRASLGHRAALREASAIDAAARLFAALGRERGACEATLLLPSSRVEEFLELPPAGALALRAGRIAARAKEALRRSAPSAVANDGRAVALAVDEDSDPELSALLRAHGERSGAPLLLHADFALRGAAAVCGEADAVEAFRRTKLDALLVDDRLYEER